MSTNPSEELRFVFDFSEDPPPVTRRRPAETAWVPVAEPAAPATVLRAQVDRVRSVATGKAHALDQVEGGLERSAGDDASDSESLSIAQFYDRLRRVLADEFSQEIWIVGEIRGLRESRGHRYLELADHGVPVVGRGATQQLEVVCWAREWPTVAAALREVGISLEVGQVVRVRGKVSVWEGGSKIRFTLTALDIEALLGQIAQARRRLLLALEREGLLDANKRVSMSLVPLRIGLITSRGSEAHHDFVGQLDRSGFAFEVRLESSFVQGSDAPTQLAAALGRLAAFNPDVCVIVRGGGGRGDLAAFDSEVVARAVATARFPVWTGIGHTNDRSVVDEVAQLACITPTACGEAIVARVASYWGAIVLSGKRLASMSVARLDGARARLAASERTMARAARRQLDHRHRELIDARWNLGHRIEARLSREQGALSSRSSGLSSAVQRSFLVRREANDRHARLLRAFDPDRQLARGWTLTSDENGRVLRRASEVGNGARLLTRFVDGVVAATVDEVRSHTTSDENRLPHLFDESEKSWPN